MHADKVMFDFVTYYHGQFERLFTGPPFSEIRYVRLGEDSTASFDIVIFNIEYLDDLKNGIEFGDKKYELISCSNIINPRIANPIQDGNPLWDGVKNKNGDIWAIPLLWGTNSIVIKWPPNQIGDCNDDCVKTFNDFDEFDVNWILDLRRKFYKALKRRENAWVVALDWDLPTMSPIAKQYYRRDLKNLDARRLDIVKGKLENLSTLLHQTYPFADDPLVLRDVLLNSPKDECLIILGGGSWLIDQERPGIRMLPLARGDIVWWECLSFLEHCQDESNEPNQEWFNGAQRLFKWLWKRRTEITEDAVIRAYQPDDQSAIQRVFELETLLASVRPLPPTDDGSNSVTSKKSVTRKQCEDVWEE